MYTTQNRPLQPWECAFRWHHAHSHFCAPVTTTRLRALSLSSQTETPAPRHDEAPPASLVPGSHRAAPHLHPSDSSRASGKGSCPLLVLLHLAYSTEHHVLQAVARYSRCQNVLFLWPRNIPRCIDHALFIQSSADGHLQMGSPFLYSP